MSFGRFSCTSDNWQQPRTDAGGQVCFPGLGNVFRGEEHDLVVGMWFDIRDPTDCFLMDSYPLLSPDILRESTYFCTRYHKAYSASLESTTFWVGVIQTSSNITEEHEAAASSRIWWEFGWIATMMLSSNFFPFGNELEGCINSRRLRHRPIPQFPRVFSASAEKKIALAGANTISLHYDHQLWWYRNLGNFLPPYMSIIPIHLKRTGGIGRKPGWKRFGNDPESLLGNDFPIRLDWWRLQS